MAITGLPKPRPRVLEKREAKRQREQDWQAVRKAVLQRDGWRCRVSGHGAHEGRLEVHHLKNRSQGREDSTRNCMVLCALHHELVRLHHIHIRCHTAKGADGPCQFEERSYL